MNHCGILSNTFSGHDEEMRTSVPRPVSDVRDHIVCPKPRRLSNLQVAVNGHADSFFRWNVCHQVEQIDMAAGPDLLDFLLKKDCRSVDQSFTQLASTPPFLRGSPPSRVANPLIQDDRFGDENFIPFSPIASPSGQLSPPTATSRKGGGLVRASFGNKPTVRIEGFDCLDRDRQNCSIPAFA
ncbi:uncharacterized protein LOC111467698 [Cucurbita maxima]|uniref:Uncharacterized protein LOC111467698 n=1 Tax=Cucurbita maxima TaxID=3661 RepID=A0A6J1HUX4_CUCMA|nr:uncharacterized protein LOC111467698 [Cucurbita maxima]XP_022968462.1 uncharacterized protein LOC111467698 [Cucurbita maxima]